MKINYQFPNEELRVLDIEDDPVQDRLELKRLSDGNAKVEVDANIEYFKRISSVLLSNIDITANQTLNENNLNKFLIKLLIKMKDQNPTMTNDYNKLLEKIRDRKVGALFEAKDTKNRNYLQKSGAFFGSLAGYLVAPLTAWFAAIAQGWKEGKMRGNIKGIGVLGGIFGGFRAIFVPGLRDAALSLGNYLFPGPFRIATAASHLGSSKLSFWENFKLQFLEQGLVLGSSKMSGKNLSNITDPIKNRAFPNITVNGIKSEIQTIMDQDKIKQDSQTKRDAGKLEEIKENLEHAKPKSAENIDMPKKTSAKPAVPVTPQADTALSSRETSMQTSKVTQNPERPGNTTPSSPSTPSH
jgi:hypothetical protein